MRCLLGGVGSRATESDVHLFQFFAQTDSFCKFSEVSVTDSTMLGYGNILQFWFLRKLMRSRERVLEGVDFLKCTR